MQGPPQDAPTIGVGTPARTGVGPAPTFCAVAGMKMLFGSAAAPSARCRSFTSRAYSGTADMLSEKPDHGLWLSVVPTSATSSSNRMNVLPRGICRRYAWKSSLTAFQVGRPHSSHAWCSEVGPCGNGTTPSNAGVCVLGAGNGIAAPLAVQPSASTETYGATQRSRNGCADAFVMMLLAEIPVTGLDSEPANMAICEEKNSFANVLVSGRSSSLTR